MPLRPTARRSTYLAKVTARALRAFRQAVAEVIEDHRRTGRPVPLWRDGKVVMVPPDELPARRTRR